MNIRQMKYVMSILVLGMSLSAMSQKKAISIEDMAEWPFVEKVSVSNKGSHVGYVLKSEVTDPNYVVYDQTTGKNVTFHRAKSADFTTDESFVILKVSPGQSLLDSLERRKVKKEKKPTDTLAIYNLSTKELKKIAWVKKHQLNDSFPNKLVFEIDRISTASKDSTSKKPKIFKKDEGKPLIILDLKSGRSDTIWEVTKWEMSSSGRHLAAISSAKDSTQTPCIWIYDLMTNSKYKVNDEKLKVSQMSSDVRGEQWLFIVDRDQSKSYVRPYEVMSWSLGHDSLKSIISGTLDNLSPGNRVSPFFDPVFSKDGSSFIFGYNRPIMVKDSNQLERETVDVEIWSTKDPLIYTIQNVKNKALTEKSLHARYDITNAAIVRLTDAEVDNLTLDKENDSRFALAWHNESYLPNIVFEGHDYKDLYGLDLETGDRWLIEKAVHGSPKLSPEGNFAYWYNPSDTMWMGHDLDSRITYKWTDETVGRFENEWNDNPRPAGSNGMAGFSKDESTVFIYDRYDIWAINTRGNLEASRLTQGREKKTRHRWLDTDPMDESIDISKPQLLSIHDETSKKEAYAFIDMNSGAIDSYVLSSFRFGTKIIKAKKGSTMVFTKENYNTAPDLLMARYPDLTTLEKLTNLDEHQLDYTWGEIKLVEWNKGEVQQTGMIVLPEDFDPSKKYPLIVNFYERSSQRLNQYRRPYLHRSTMNYPHYSSRGYIIFNPDIKYKTGYPGQSALDIVNSGVDHLIEQGYIDQERIALQGHSWGGYQIAYILAHSDRFVCAEAGAPVVNMVSAYGGIRWKTGMSRMFQYEQTQSRLGATLWEDPEAYLRNSPIFNMDEVSTPVLILHNDKDGAVPWYQGIEYYMALRRLGKKAWFLNYRGEDHWPQKFESRKDFQTRMAQFFDHYVLDQPQPRWMFEGIPAHLRGIDERLDLMKTK